MDGCVFIIVLLGGQLNKKWNICLLGMVGFDLYLSMLKRLRECIHIIYLNEEAFGCF